MAFSDIGKEKHSGNRKTTSISQQSRRFHATLSDISQLEQLQTESCHSVYQATLSPMIVKEEAQGDNPKGFQLLFCYGVQRLTWWRSLCYQIGLNVDLCLCWSYQCHKQQESHHFASSHLFCTERRSLIPLQSKILHRSAHCLPDLSPMMVGKSTCLTNGGSEFLQDSS